MTKTAQNFVSSPFLSLPNSNKTAEGEKTVGKIQDSYFMNQTPAISNRTSKNERLSDIPFPQQDLRTNPLTHLIPSQSMKQILLLSPI